MGRTDHRIIVAMPIVGNTLTIITEIEDRTVDDLGEKSQLLVDMSIELQLGLPGMGMYSCFVHTYICQ